VSDFYDISLELLQNGKKLDADMSKFNDRVSFTIPTTEKGNAVFSFDPETGKFSFVPATFSESGATVRTAHHSIYVVPERNTLPS
ncbi:MAG: hypothetical protein KA282_03625, partial [Clostridia bacterium]|nr:hypothetical protein [Clostridia bacterium]